MHLKAITEAWEDDNERARELGRVSLMCGAR